MILSIHYKSTRPRTRTETCPCYCIKHKGSIFIKINSSHVKEWESILNNKKCVVLQQKHNIIIEGMRGRDTGREREREIERRERGERKREKEEGESDRELARDRQTERGRER